MSIDKLNPPIPSDCSPHLASTGEQALSYVMCLNKNHYTITSKHVLVKLQRLQQKILIAHQDILKHNYMVVKCGIGLRKVDLSSHPQISRW